MRRLLTLVFVGLALYAVAVVIAAQPGLSAAAIVVFLLGAVAVLLAVLIASGD